MLCIIQEMPVSSTILFNVPNELLSGDELFEFDVLVLVYSVCPKRTSRNGAITIERVNALLGAPSVETDTHMLLETSSKRLSPDQECSLDTSNRLC